MELGKNYMSIFILKSDNENKINKCKINKIKQATIIKT